MPEFSSHFQEERNGPEPWREDADLVQWLVKWLQGACLLKGHQIRPAERITDPESWRKMCARRLAKGRNYDTMQIRDTVLRVIAQTEPELAAKLTAPKETHDTPDVKIAESETEPADE